jgi:hypothetical protein
VDDIWVDCDVFDDGMDNDSCPTTFLGLTGRPIGATERVFDEGKFCVGGDSDGLPCTDIKSHSDCPPGAFIPPDPNNEGRCLQLSHTNIDAAGPVPPGPVFQLNMPLTGGSVIDCGAVDPHTGLAECTCEITGIQGVDLNPTIGFICFEPIPGCPPGLIDCDGGIPLDTELLTDHHIEPQGCGLGLNDPNRFPIDDDPNLPGVGNAECAWLCQEYCEELPGNFEYLLSSCEGYCFGGDRADRMCTVGSECPGGVCTGPEGAPHVNHCQCQCIEIGGNPSRPGGYYCLSGLRIVVEQNGPCDGFDVSSIVGTRCGTNATERARASILNTNLFGWTFSRGPSMGVPFDSCNLLTVGESRGSTAVGHRIFHDGGGTLDQISTSTTKTIPKE